MVLQRVIVKRCRDAMLKNMQKTRLGTHGPIVSAVGLGSLALGRSGPFGASQDVTVPAVAMSPSFITGQALVGAATQRTMDVDYFAFWGKGLSR